MTSPRHQKASCRTESDRDPEDRDREAADQQARRGANCKGDEIGFGRGALDVAHRFPELSYASGRSGDVHDVASLNLDIAPATKYQHHNVEFSKRSNQFVR